MSMIYALTDVNNDRLILEKLLDITSLGREQGCRLTPFTWIWCFVGNILRYRISREEPD